MTPGPWGFVVVDALCELGGEEWGVVGEDGEASFAVGAGSLAGE